MSDISLCLTRLFLPVTGSDGAPAILYADCSPEGMAWLKACAGDVPLYQVSRAELHERLRARFDPQVLDEAVFGLGRAAPELSARTVVTRRQRAFFLSLASIIVAILIVAPGAMAGFAALALSLGYMIASLFRASLALLGSRALPHTVPSSTALPPYTIMVPLYREVAVLPGLVRALGKLDYPAELLDIKLVLEADDQDTIAAARALSKDAPVPLELVLVPHGGPRTKPKAINHALAFARGEYVVVYDAEDRPEPDQLKRAVATFRAGPRTLACLQARLNFYNARHNWLTRGIMAQTPLV